jgi:hypothetical protein
MRDRIRIEMDFAAVSFEEEDSLARKRLSELLKESKRLSVDLGGTYQIRQYHYYESEEDKE